MKKLAYLVSGAALLASGLAGATELSINLGPVVLPTVPASVCVDSNCIGSPTISAPVTLTVTVSVEPSLGGLPTVTTSPCPAGQAGSVFSIGAAGTGLTVEAVISGTLPNSTVPVSYTTGPVGVDPHGNANVTGCADASAGV